MNFTLKYELHPRFITSSLDGEALFDFDSNQKVVISPLPLTVIVPLSLVTKDAGSKSFKAL